MHSYNSLSIQSVSLHIFWIQSTLFRFSARTLSLSRTMCSHFSLLLCFCTLSWNKRGIKMWMIAFRLKSSVWSFICLCIMSVLMSIQRSIFINAIVVSLFQSLVRYLTPLLPPSSKAAMVCGSSKNNIKIMDDSVYCLVMAICWITLFIWLWWLSQDLYFEFV